MSTIAFRLRLVALLAVSALLAACASAAGPTSSPTAPAAAPAPPSVASIPESTLLRGFGTMWTFDNPPIAYWKKRYGFAPDHVWLDHVRLAAVRLPQCSASLVSARGLVMTNHHCGRDCSAAVSPRDSNYVETGFAAASLADEKRCPGFHVDQLQSIEDVTARVQGAMTGRTLVEQTSQRDTQIHAIETECEQRTKLLCQVVMLYEGGRYSLYRYRRYEDIRLVMAPEKNIAYFGGDPDNFTYPRYDLDLTLLRVYEHGAPLATTDYLRWSKAGAAPGELVFVIGNPGSTNRLLTVAQLEYLRDVQYPSQLAAVDRILRALRADSARGPERARALQNEIFEYANAQKAWTGEYAGLRDTMLMNRKRALEQDFRARADADARLRARYGSAWDQIASATRELASFANRLKWSTLGGFGATLGEFAQAIVRLAELRSLPDSARPPGLRGAALDSLKQVLSADVPIDTALERTMLVERLRAMQRELAPNDPIRRAWLDDQSPEQAAQRLVGGTKVASAAERRRLIEGGMGAIASSTDPLIVLARTLAPINRQLQARAELLGATVDANEQKIGQALFAVYGTSIPPDATFTLRITDGVVKGYPMNGTIAPPHTTFYGLYDRAAAFGDDPPFAIPTRWKRGQSRLDLATPFDLASTNDIIGGNSGSPMVNRSGEVVGLIFDGNIESLPNDFFYTDAVARAVSVDSRAIVEALRRMYDAQRIADELVGAVP